MRRLLILCLICLPLGVSALEGLFAGLGTEINGNSVNEPAISASLVLGLDLHPHWGLGLKASYSHNMDDTSVLEPQALLRYYLAPLCRGPYAQAEAGCSIIFATSNTHPVLTGAWAMGWRFNLTTKGYLEPALRIGYPFFWGLNLTAGFLIRRQ